MNQHLKQAIGAARAGKEAEAKILLARVIKEEPDNVNAWFLLSSLADTEEQKVLHLEKVLELQPGHPAASQQLAELMPMVPEAAEEPQSQVAEMEDEVTPEMFPLPDVDLPGDEAPEDPDEAMAWLERLAAEQGASPDELPSIAEDSDTADTILNMQALDYTESDFESEDNVPDDPDEAMAWLERLAADQGASLDELPTVFDEEAVSEIDDDTFAWLDKVDEEEHTYLETLPTLVDEVEEELSWETEEEEEEDEEEGEPARPSNTLSISNESLDFVSQAEGDSIPSWMVDDVDFISADTLITDPVDQSDESLEPENLPDWLNEMPAADWAGEEREKSGQVVWKAGEGDESLKPESPTKKKAVDTGSTARQTTKSGDNSSFYLALLGLMAILLIFAILYLLINQPF